MDENVETKEGADACPRCGTPYSFTLAAWTRHAVRCARRAERERDAEEQAAAREMLGRHDGLDRFGAVLVIAALVVLGSLLGAGNAMAGVRENPALSRLASTYVGHPVTVTCADTFDDFLAESAREGAPAGSEAFAEPWNGTAFLRGEDCAKIDRLASGRMTMRGRGEQDIYDAGGTALVLTHESTHLLGIYDEAQTECLAVRNVWRMLGYMGLKGKARSIAYQGALYWHSRVPSAYRAVC